MQTYIKKDLIDRVVEQSGERPDIVATVIAQMFNSLRQILTMDNEELRIEIRDFGVFEIRRTKSRPHARNPKTNELIYVPARRKAHFKPGKVLRGALKESVTE